MNPAQLNTLIEELKGTLTQLEWVSGLLKNNPWAIASILDPRTVVSEAIDTRKILHTIYTRTAVAMGRNSPNAVKADTQRRVRDMIWQIRAYYPKNHANILDWVNIEILPYLDQDMIAFATDMSVYRIKGLDPENQKKIDRAYAAMITYRRWSLKPEKDIPIKARRKAKNVK
jgi:hypothetical protein